MEFDYNLSTHHIGGRAGTMEFPFFKDSKFDKNIVRVLYDADTSCIASIKEIYGTSVNVKVLPLCISDKTEKTLFYLTADRYNSSLVRPADKMEQFVYNKQFGWNFDLENSIDEEIEIDAVSMDDIYGNVQYKEIPTPDFLSLDVEGAESRLLNGATRILSSKVLALKCEFHSLKDAQELIEQVKQFGFELVDVRLFDSSFKSDREISVGLIGVHNGSKEVGDLTFFKSVSYIEKYHANPLLDLLKLSFISFVSQKIDYMYQYYHEALKSENARVLIEFYGRKVYYIKFLFDFFNVYDAYPNIKPIKFSELFPNSKSRTGRFVDGLLDIVQIREQYFQHTNKDEFLNSINYMLSNEDIGVEYVCHQYGFLEIAMQFKTARINSVFTLVSRLGLVKCDENNNTFLDAKILEELKI